MSILKSLSNRVAVILTLCIGMSFTFVTCLLVRQSQDEQIRANFQRDVDKIAFDTSNRLKAHFDMLLSIKGLFASSLTVERDEFAHFINELDLQRRYPGFQVIQFVRMVPQAQRDSFEQSVRNDTRLVAGGYPNFSLRPDSAQDPHFVIEFCEPMKGNEGAFGYDLASNPLQKRALELGRDSGAIIATEPIRLVQEVGNQAGFVARAPIYRNGMPIDTLEQRRNAIFGFTAIVFRADNLMQEVIDRDLLPHMTVRIQDTGYFHDKPSATPAPGKLLFDSERAFPDLKFHAAALANLSTTTTLNIGERRWELQFSARDGRRYGRNNTVIALLACGGAIISLLAAALLLAFRRRRALAERLRLALDEQNAFQDNAVVGIVLIADRLIRRSNRGVEEMMGYAAGELIGTSLRQFFRSDDDYRAAGKELLTRTNSGERWKSEWELLRKDGTLIWCMFNGKIVDVDDVSKGIVWVVFDITDRKLAEAALVEAHDKLARSLAEVEQQKSKVQTAHDELAVAMDKLQLAKANLIFSEKMASLGSLVAGIAHELNTPIGNSLLAATALSDRVAEFEQVAAAGNFKRSALVAHLTDTRVACNLLAGSLHKAAHLIASFKQVSVDQTIDDRRRFDLCNVLQDTLATYAVQLRRGNCEATLDAPQTLVLDSYPGSIGQIISNLIANALLHAFDGHTDASIHVAAHEMDANWIEIVFRDDGAGMAPEILHRIFDPFFTTKMGQGGSGLGMNIVYNIVTGILGGRINIDSEVGQGCNVRIVIPKVAPLRERTEKAPLF